MRKLQQDKILELLRTLREAHSELRRQTEREVLVSLLANCQEFAIEIVRYIDNVAGEGTRTAAYLNEYYELLYKTSLENDVKGHIEDLQEQIGKIRNEVRIELKTDKIEVAFFPYQLSMFDTFESVYLAAKADPDCDVYVVPVPWFDKLPNGEVGRIHYDGDQYPAYIRVTSWEQYDVEVRHPDIIFIHSPYDEGNYVTSIHPDFYSRRLRNCTDLLVYIPYYIHAGDVPLHFCTTAGCIYAHKTILQSDNVRDVYVNEFKKTFGTRFGKPEDKFVALGSPKIDAVITGRAEDFSVSETWNKLMYNMNGKKKKIVLYNTSVGSILLFGDKYLERLHQIINIFKERDDVVLWWRPHPLSLATYQSMRPQLLTGYKRIVAEYKQKGFGIFDDSPSLHRAIAMSDGLISDPSSIVALYEAADKPILIQTISSDFNIQQLYIEDEHIWFAIQHSDVLFKISKKDFSLSYVKRFEISGSLRYTPWIYVSVVGHGDKLYLAPAFSEQIGIYDKSTGEYSHIPIRNETSVQLNDLKMFYSCTYKDSIFFAGVVYPAIIEFDTISGQVSYHSDYVDQVKSVNNGCKYLLGGFGVVNKNIMAVIVGNSNAILLFDMEKCCSSVIPVPSKNKGYASICFDGQSYWLSPAESGGELVYWNSETGTNILKAPKDFMSDGMWLSCYAGGFVWYFPSSCGEAFRVDMKTFTFEKADVFVYSGEESVYTMVQTEGSVIYAYMNQKQLLVTYDTKTGVRTENRIAVSLAEKYRFIGEITKDRKCIRVLENPLTTVEDFVNIVCDPADPELYEVKRVHKDATTGQKIYDYIKGQVLIR